MCQARWLALGCWATSSLLALSAFAAETAPPSGAAPAPAPSSATEAATASAPPTYALSWVRAEGAEECPNGHALASEVERRLGRAVFDVAAERSLEVEVTRFGAIYRSDVYVRDASGHAIGHRQLQSDEPGCAALVNATALAIALVIDPAAATRPPAPPKAAAAFEAPPPASAPAPAPVAVVSAPTVAAPPAVAMRLPLPPPPTAVTLSARAQVVAGLVPGTSAGFELSFSARPSRRWGYALSASLALSQSVARGIGSLDLGLTRASALVTFDAGHSENIQLVLAAGPTLGAFHVAVRTPAPVTDPGDYWFVAAELLADLQVRVTDGVFVELGSAGIAPLQRQEFLVRSQADPVWRQPLVSGLGFAGVGAMFP